MCQSYGLQFKYISVRQGLVNAVRSSGLHCKCQVVVGWLGQRKAKIDQNECTSARFGQFRGGGLVGAHPDPRTVGSVRELQDRTADSLDIGHPSLVCA